MILADTSVWVDHLRSGDPLMAYRLDEGQIWSHPHVIGEIALGSLRQRAPLLSMLDGLPKAPVASDEEVRGLIDTAPLYSLGIGYVDAHLIASARLKPPMRLWTRDRRLNDVAMAMGLAVTEK